MPIPAIDQGPDSRELDTITIPLHQCPPLVILQELHEHWGDTCSPCTNEEGTLPEGWTRIDIRGTVRYYRPEDIDGLMSDLAATLDKHTPTTHTTEPR